MIVPFVEGLLMLRDRCIAGATRRSSGDALAPARRRKPCVGGRASRQNLPEDIRPSLARVDGLSTEAR
jgi:hypothetical protein